MFNEKHELAQEFPEYKDLIHQLKSKNAHFAKLQEEYHAVTRQITRIEQEIETVSDVVSEDLKKQRLVLKDAIFAILKAA